MSLPEQVIDDASTKVAKGTKERIPLRTKEEVHACTNQYVQVEEDDVHFVSSSHESFGSTPSGTACHTHNLEYVSASSPAESETYSNLRRATIRTLSGEQLPRGQTSGPLWFGDPVAGFTIAYVFRLADSHARGRQRYYALLALAGSETKRAFEACTLIWSYFEQIAMNIVEAAEDVAARSFVDDSPPERGQVTPISSFLTGRTMDPDGYPRRGTANVRANGIAELVDNERFFCELHMMFVGILQDLGHLLGGLKVRPALVDSETGDVAAESGQNLHTFQDDADEDGKKNEKKFSVVPTKTLTRLGDDPQPILSRCPTPRCSQALVPHRHEVAV
ncbi:hypothetical protein MMC30_007484 [Trapelia coarctata]|nr:hypothetical protein [Trapelia coarctata]